MYSSRSGRAPWTAGLAATSLAVSLAALIPATASAGTAPGGTASDGTASAGSGRDARSPAARPIPHPGHAGRLHITGRVRDGGTDTAAGLRWHPGKLPRGDKLLSFAVG